MQREIKKVIYYYYDEEGNRRPIIESNYLLDNFKTVVDKFPQSKENLYAMIDGFEFKLL